MQQLDKHSALYPGGLLITALPLFRVSIELTQYTLLWGKDEFGDVPHNTLGAASVFSLNKNQRK